jgi:hypothetical protein
MRRKPKVPIGFFICKGPDGVHYMMLPYLPSSEIQPSITADNIEQYETIHDALAAYNKYVAEKGDPSYGLALLDIPETERPSLVWVNGDGPIVFAKSRTDGKPFWFDEPEEVVDNSTNRIAHKVHAALGRLGLNTNLQYAIIGSIAEEGLGFVEKRS